MKKLVIALVALLPLTGAVQAQTLNDLLATLRASWDKPTEPFKMIDNVYYVGTDGLASYLITSPQGHILVDTVMPETTSQIKANIEKLGFKVADIKYLLNTHAHIDHAGGLAEMKQATGAQVVAGEADKPLLEGGYYPGAREETVLAFPPVKVDRAVREGDTVTVGNVTLTAHENPRPLARLHELGILGEGRRCDAFGSDFLQRDRGAEPACRQPDLSRHRRRLQEDVRAGEADEG